MHNQQPFAKGLLLILYALHEALRCTGFEAVSTSKFMYAVPYHNFLLNLTHRTNRNDDRYYDNPNLVNPIMSVATSGEMINKHLPLRYYDKVEANYQYATTYDCPLKGNVTIRIDGLNFGKNPRVFIGTNECVVTDSYRENEVRACIVSCDVGMK